MHDTNHFYELFCIGLVSVLDFIIKRSFFVTFEISTGQANKFGNISMAIS